MKIARNIKSLKLTLTLQQKFNKIIPMLINHFYYLKKIILKFILCINKHFANRDINMDLKQN